ncbi:MAG: Hpt domain-containing protein [Treponema sp.]|jgi:HPt (histidine-containing phosphotransfer) domain-containing protein|nr:Hpt domain-containing protein [Treponema sp.]
MADDRVYVDEADGIKRVMNNTKLYVRLLTKFKNENNLNDLNSFLGAGDLEKAQAAAHTIKGIAANLSLTALFQQSLEIETQIKNKAVDQGTVDSLNGIFAETLAEVDKVLAKYA